MNKKQQHIFDFIDFADNSEDVLYIKGTFGVGKSHLLSIFKHEFIDSHNNITFYDYLHNSQVEYLHEFIYNLAMSCFTPSLHDPKETFDNRNFFLNLLNQSYSIDKDFYRQIKSANILKNVPAFLSASEPNVDVSQITDKYQLRADDARLLFDADIISAESFVVDLLGRLYPSTTNETKSIPSQTKKILFVIDNYDKAAGSVNNWLFNHFFACLKSKTFADYTFYDINSFPPSATASDFINCKFIIAGREELKPISDFVKYSVLNIEPLTKSEILQSFESNNIDISENYEVIHQITQGLPYLIGLIIESIVVGDGEIQDLPRIEHLAGLRAMNYLSPSEQDYLRAASFLIDFDSEALGFLPLIKDKAESAFAFFSTTTEFACPTENGRLAIKPGMKALIKNEVAVESQKAAKTFESIANLYNSYHQLMKNFLPEERLIIRKLAYFNNFDRFFAIQEIFGDNAAAVRRIVEKYPVLFLENNHTFKMDDNVSTFILTLENLAQSDVFESTSAQIRDAWSAYIAELNTDLAKIDKELSEIQTGLETLEKQDSLLFQEQKKCEADSNAAEVELEELNGKITKYKIESNILMWALPLTISIVLAYISFLSDIKLAGFLNNSSIFTIFLLGSFGAYRLFKFVKASSGKPEFIADSNRSNELNNNLPSSLNRIKSIKAERDILSGNLRKAKSLRDKLNVEFETIKMKLKEPFVREEN